MVKYDLSQKENQTIDPNNLYFATEWASNTVDEFTTKSYGFIKSFDGLNVIIEYNPDGRFLNIIEDEVPIDKLRLDGILLSELAKLREESIPAVVFANPSVGEYVVGKIKGLD